MLLQGWLWQNRNSTVAGKTSFSSWYQFSQFSCSVVSDSLRPHGLQHARLLCLWLTPRAYSNSCPSSWWCHPTISSSVVSFSSCLQSFPASWSFPLSQFFASDGWSIQLQHQSFQWIWFPLGLTGLQSKGLYKESSPTPQFRSINSFTFSFLLVQLSQPYMTTGKTITLTRWTFVGKVISLLFNMLSRLVIAFLPRSKPDILEWEVKWTLGSITMNKANGGDRIPVELFQILKDDAVKVLHSICQQIWKTQQCHRTGKGQFSF